MIDPNRLAEYLNDHLAGAELALQILRRRATAGTDPLLAGVLEEIESDRGVLEGFTADLDLSQSPVKKAAGWLGEKIVRLKSLFDRAHRSALGDLQELELLQIGIAGKRGLWVLLQALQDEDPRIAELSLDELIRRADSQSDRVQAARIQTARDALTT